MQAIADGATIDEITARIHGPRGGTCSRSAVGRYAKDMRDLIRQQQETDRQIEAWVQRARRAAGGPGGARPDREPCARLALATMAALSKRDEPASTEELARLSLALVRIESADKRRLEREQTAASKAAAERRKANGQGGLSPEAVAIIRAEVEGRPRPTPRTVTSVPVDPWNPDEYPLSQPIPDNPGEVWPEIAPRVYRTSPQSILSLGPEGSGPP